MLPLILALAFLSQEAGAGHVESIKNGVETIERINRDKPRREPNCPGLVTRVASESCEAQVASLCNSIMDDKDGNAKVFDGELFKGESASGLDMSVILDYKALISSKDRLPADLKPKMEPVLSKLASVLERENLSVEWKRELADTMRDYTHALENTAHERSMALHPELAKKRYDWLKIHEKHEVDTVLDNLRDEVTKAKYAESPAWQRAEKLFPQAKENVLNAVEELRITPELKSLMKERVRSIRMLLPLISENESEDCGTTKNEAHYISSTHNFVLCAGYLNTYQSDSVVLTTIMHEISHSIDPDALAELQADKGPVASRMTKLSGARGPAYPCEEWKKIQAEAMAAKLPSPPPQELDKLLECLEPSKQLKAFDPARIAEISESDAEATIKVYADGNYFTYLAQPSFNAWDQLNPNYRYMRPDLGYLKKKGQLSNAYPRDPHILEIFTQSLACQTGFENPNIPDEERAKMVAAALQESKGLLAKIYAEDYHFIGNRTSELRPHKMGRPTGEAFAEWMANRARRTMLRKIESPELRKQIAIHARAKLCEGASVIRAAPRVNAEEYSYSSETHPTIPRHYRAVFDLETAHLAGCEPNHDPNENFGLCEP